MKVTGNQMLNPSSDEIKKEEPKTECITKNTFTIIPDGIMMSKDLNNKQKLMLCYLLRQVAYQHSPKVLVSSSKIAESTGMSLRNVYYTQEPLISKGLLKKETEAYSNGVITKYILNIPKIEKTFGFDYNSIYNNK